MKEMIVTVIAAVAALTACKEYPTPEFTMLNDHINVVARQEGISYAEAAAALWESGVTGIDMFTDIDREEYASLKALGFKCSCAVAVLDCVNGFSDNEAGAALAFARDAGTDRILLVPGFGSDPLREEELDASLGHMRSFVETAAENGISVLLEDFDNFRSPCCGMSRLETIFGEIPGLKLAFDTGNFLFSGDDVLAALDIFDDRIAHVHLKDRTDFDDMSCPAVGDGVIPMREIIAGLEGYGYDGWYMIELYGSGHMLEDTRKSIDYVRNLN